MLRSNPLDVNFVYVQTSYDDKNYENLRPGFVRIVLFGCFARDSFAQQKHKKLTIILLRHAEKDKAEEEITPDPRLAPPVKSARFD